MFFHFTNWLFVIWLPATVAQSNEPLLLIDIALGITKINILIQLEGFQNFSRKVSFSRSANFSAFSHITYSFVLRILAKLQAFNFFETGPFLRFYVASVCRFLFCSTQNKQDRKDQYSEWRCEQVK